MAAARKSTGANKRSVTRKKPGPKPAKAAAKKTTGGVSLPAKKAPAKKAPAKKAAAKKSAAKKVAVRKAPAKRTGPRGMSASHKAALATGREESRAVRAYLDALDADGPKRRGRRRTPEGIRKRLTAIEAELASARSIQRASLLQEQVNLEAELGTLTKPKTDLAPLRAGFVANLASYSTRKGITYDVWRKMGIDAATLKEAGVARG